MPSLLPGYEYDIFISYRQKDNKANHWVTEFVNALKTDLESTFKEDISIYFDENPHDGLLETHHIDKSLEGKLKCLIFIPIISQTYCDPKSFAWQQELCAFNKLSKEDQFGREIKLANGNVASRILPVRIHGLDAGDQKTLESEIGSALRAVEFIYREPGVNRPLSPDDDPSDNQNKTKYRNQVNKVANAIKEIIVGLQNFGNPDFYSASKEGLRVESKPPTGKSIVVLPFEDMSSEKDQEYFCDGLAEELINSLTKIKDIHVVARTSAFSFKGKETDVKKIGKKLKVQSLLEGSVRKAGNQLRITVQLINVADGFPLWSERYDRQVADVFAIQDEITMNIVDKLRINLLGEEKKLILKRHTENVEAHSFYLRGLHFFRQATMDGMQKALESFQHAIESDPNYAPPFAALAHTYIYESTSWLALPALETMPKARAAARQAFALDPTLPEAHVSLALIASYYDWDLPAADRAFKEALRLNPSYAEAHGWYTVPLIWLDTRFAEALDHARRSIDLNPVDPWAWFQLLCTHYFSRDFDGAITQARHLINLEPLWGLGHYGLGFALATAGRAAEALESINRAIELDGRGVHCVAWLGLSNAIAGKKAEALACLAELERHEKEGKSVSAWKLVVHAGLGDSDAVMRCLSEAFDERSASLMFHLTHPLVDSLRGDPRFLDLLRRMGLEHLATYKPNPAWKPIGEFNKTFSVAPSSRVPGYNRSIVVLPFENLSSDKENEYFSDGLTEEIIANLSRIKSLKVLSRTSSMHYKDAKKPLAEIAKELGVEYVLEGSVRKQGKDIRITTQLIETSEDRHLWTETYDRRLKDIFVIQSDIALRVGESLKSSLTKEEEQKIQGHPTESVEAYEYYLLGRYHWFRFTEEGVKKAGEFFSKALSLDPQFAPAHAGLANTYLMRGGAPLNILPASVAMPIAKREAEHSIKLNPNFGDAYESLALIQCWFEWDWKAASETAKKGTEVDPNSALAWAAYGHTLDVQGKHEESIRAVTRALELDPLSGLILENAANIHRHARKNDQAKQYAHRLIQLIPNFPIGVLAYCQILLFEGKDNEAYELIEPMSHVMKSYDFGMAILAFTLGRSGHKKEAIQLAKKLEVQCHEGRASWADVALAYLGVGDSELAFKFLEKAPDQRPAGGLLTAYLGVTPLFDSIRDDKRYQRVLQRLGFPSAVLSLSSSAVLSSKTEKSIVVLPFENMSPDKENEYFSDGLTEEIIADLSKVQELSVISRSSAMTFKGTKKKTKEIAADVNVRYVLEGSVRKEGNNLRITAQLIDGTTDVHLWAEKYTGALDHVFEIQEKLSRSIVTALKVRLSTGEDQKLAERPLTDIRAYEFYLRARKEFSTHSKEGLHQALQLVKEALTIVGDNELLYGTLANIYYGLWFGGFSGSDKAHERETEICMQKAFQLNPESPHGYFAAGVLDFMQGKRQEATRNFKQAMTLDPANMEPVQILGILYLDVGRPEVADPLLRRILALDPLTAFNQAMVGYLEWQQGRFQTALPYWQRMYELEPDVPANAWSFACALASAGLPEKSQALVDRMSENLLASPFGKMALFLKHALSGNESAGLALLSPEFTGFAKSLPFVSRDIAGYFGMIGHVDEGLDWVENAINLGYINYPFLALHHPFYGTLRSHPRFAKLMERIRPQWEAFEV